MFSDSWSLNSTNQWNLIIEYLNIKAVSVRTAFPYAQSYYYKYVCSLSFFIEAVNTKIKHCLWILCPVPWHGALALLSVESLNEGKSNVYLIYTAALREKSGKGNNRMILEFGSVCMCIICYSVCNKHSSVVLIFPRSLGMTNMTTKPT